MEIAIFGGTFNPPTTAHQNILSACAELPFIDEVWLMPSGQRHDKQFEIEECHRVEMLNIMIGEIMAKKAIRIETIELQSGEYTKTSETAKLLKPTYPDHRFWFVFGVDSYDSMEAWDEGKILKDSLRMLLAPRAGYVLPKENKRVRHLEVPGVVDLVLSSTQVRTKAAQGDSLSGLVCQGVASYISSHNLYQVSPAMQ